MNSKFLYWEKQSTVDMIVQSMHRGQVCVTTTDTVLGLLAPLTSQGFNRLNAIKLRSEKSYVVLVDTNRKVFALAAPVNLLQVEKLMVNCWPGPLTLIFKAHPGLPEWAKSPQNTIAVRIPNHAGLRSVLSNFDALFSTSANISGQMLPGSIDDLDPRIMDEVAYIVSDEIDGPHTLPSTILDCSGQKIKVVREGAYSIAELEKIVGESLGS